jgi:hypothetical protein
MAKGQDRSCARCPLRPPGMLTAATAWWRSSGARGAAGRSPRYLQPTAREATNCPWHAEWRLAATGVLYNQLSACEGMLRPNRVRRCSVLMEATGAALTHEACSIIMYSRCFSKCNDLFPVELLICLPRVFGVPISSGYCKRHVDVAGEGGIRAYLRFTMLLTCYRGFCRPCGISVPQ